MAQVPGIANYLHIGLNGHGGDDCASFLLIELHADEPHGLSELWDEARLKFARAMMHLSIFQNIERWAVHHGRLDYPGILLSLPPK